MSSLLRTAAEAYIRACAETAQGSPPRRQAARERALSDGDAPSAMDWAFECFAGYDFRAGHEALGLALQRDPGFLAARWLGFQYPLDPSPASTAEQAAYIERWRAGLRWFESQDFRRPELAGRVWGCVGSVTPFYLHYLDDAIPEMRRYGRLLARMMAALSPGLPQPQTRRPGPRRIAVPSTHFREHTVARLFLPLLEALDRRRFELHFLELEPAAPDWAARLEAAGHRHAGPRNPPQWLQLLAAVQPDVVLYPEIGMHPLHQGLAALRLAPLQACLWGHPVTTGLPTIDCALVPDALEPADAASHYHERLIRLPGLGHGLAPAPVRAPVEAPEGVRRAEPGSLEILCGASVFKLLPAQDTVFAEVLRALPQARLHLTPLLPDSAPLRERMRPAFAAAGVDIDSRVVMHPLMPLEQFQALAAACDFGLDSLGWSGGMSALDLLPQGLPIVAVEGPTMRSRQTAALLRWLDAPELVARDTAGMQAIARRLGEQPEWREQLRERLRANGPRLYARPDTQAALEAFLAG
ncbi:MAG: hypothetical protein MEQ07_12130 [Aquimonas sp.]|nr:hypothetical protein [Aquimonas sp.]